LRTCQHGLNREATLFVKICCSQRDGNVDPRQWARRIATTRRRGDQIDLLDEAAQTRRPVQKLRSKISAA